MHPCVKRALRGHNLYRYKKKQLQITKREKMAKDDEDACSLQAFDYKKILFSSVFQILLPNISKTSSDSEYFETNLRASPFKRNQNHKFTPNGCIQFTLGKPFLDVFGKFVRNAKGLNNNLNIIIILIQYGNKMKGPLGLL